MEHLAQFFTTIYEGFNHEFTLYGFTFSLWQVFIVTTVACIVFGAIREIYD